VALGIGLWRVSVLQAVTQINEATLTFLPKLIGVGITLVLVGPDAGRAHRLHRAHPDQHAGGDLGQPEAPPWRKRHDHAPPISRSSPG
jgi:hypothetical protein